MVADCALTKNPPGARAAPVWDGVVRCAENDPGVFGYVSSATDEQRIEFDHMFGGVPRPAFDHVMIDIETMSLHPHNALILSIGMIEFDPTGNSGADPIADLRIGERKLLLPDLEAQLGLGREVSAITQKWWMDQSPEARKHWAATGNTREHLSSVLYRIRSFCAGRDCVWAKGPQFDLSNLVGLNEQVSGEPLWHYQAPNDMRTFVGRTPATRLVPIGGALDIPGVPHEPVYDCISQAWQVWSHWAC